MIAKLILVAATIGLMIFLTRKKRVPCPSCAEKIHPDARVCKHCGTLLKADD